MKTIILALGVFAWSQLDGCQDCVDAMGQFNRILPKVMEEFSSLNPDADELYMLGIERGLHQGLRASFLILHQIHPEYKAPEGFHE